MKPGLARIFPNLFSVGAAPAGDLGGALNGALVSIPQILAFGLIIGSAMGPDKAGTGMMIALCGSILLGATTALFGGSPYVVTGPRASAVLVFAALIRQLSASPALAHVREPASSAFSLACVSVLLAGLLQFLFGAFRLGRLVNYVPLPVMLGFINGSALLIILSQIPPALGFPGEASLASLSLEETKWPALSLALGTVMMVRVFPRLTKRLPAMPLAFACATCVYQGFAMGGMAEAFGGALPPPPADFRPHFIAPEWIPGLLPEIVTAAFSIAILSSLDTLLAVAATDELTQKRSDAGRQLMAEGAGNFLAGSLGLASGSGGLGRTRAALAGGMKSPFALLGIAFVALMLVMTLAPLIGLLSNAVMAGLLIALGIELFDGWTLSRMKRLFSGQMPGSAVAEVLVVFAVIGAALAFDLKAAVGIGVLLSLLAFVAQMARSPIRRCYRATVLIPAIYGDTARRRFIERHGRRIAIVEIEGALFFGTASELGAFVDALMAEGVIHAVLDMRRVKHVDSTGAKALEKIASRIASAGGLLAVSRVEGGKLRAELADLGTLAAIGEARFHDDTDSAVADCERHLGASLDEAEGQGAEAGGILGRSLLRRLKGYLERVSYLPGERIFAQGSAPDGAYYVASGRVDVILELGSGRRRRLQSLTAGSVFGEMAMLDAKPRSAGIVAVEKTECYWINSDAFARLKRERPDLASTLLTEIALVFAERLRANTSMIAELEA